MADWRVYSLGLMENGVVAGSGSKILLLVLVLSRSIQIHNLPQNHTLLLLHSLLLTHPPPPRLTTRATAKHNIYTSIIGHVGHGKTTVNAALSIALAAFGYSYMNTEPNMPHNVIVDHPMQSDYVKTMISGVVDMAGVILVVCGVEGLTPLTEEHIWLAKLGGVPQMVVFLNKQDQLVDGGDDQMLALELEVRELLSSYEFPGDDIPIVAGSALLALEALKKEAKIKRGENEWVDKIYKLMDEMVNYIPIPSYFELGEKKLNSPFLMPVVVAFSSTRGREGATVGALGRIERGTIGVGDVVDLVGLNDTKRDVVITDVDINHYLPFGGFDVQLFLRGVQKSDIHWGMALAKPGTTIRFLRMFTAIVYMLKPEEGGTTSNKIFLNERWLLYMATSEVNWMVNDEEYENREIKSVMRMLDPNRVLPPVTGKVSRIMDDDIDTIPYPFIKPGQHAKIELELISPVACEQGMRFAIQDEERKDLGVGIILDFIE